MRLFIFLLFFQVGQMLACSCVSSELISRVSKADFIASVKIDDVQPDTDNSEYHILKIRILELYKGKKIETIRLHSDLNSSCAMLISKGSSWLVFADNNKEGVLSFGMCSGSGQLDREFDKEKYPGLKEGYTKRMKARQLMLAEARELMIDSDINYYWSVKGNWRAGFRDWDLKENSVGFYELVIDEDFNILHVNSVKGFDDSEHNEEFAKCLKKNGSIYGFSKDKDIISGTSIIIGFYYGNIRNGKNSYIQKLSTL